VHHGRRRPGSSEFSDLRTQLWTDRRRYAQAIPQRAIERGELPADTDPATLIDMLAGPIYLRRFIRGRPVPASDLAGTIAPSVHRALRFLAPATRRWQGICAKSPTPAEPAATRPPA
jgi:Tetracyclin repressor-like, C-terminal domain